MGRWRTSSVLVARSIGCIWNADLAVGELAMVSFASARMRRMYVSETGG